MVPSNLIFSCPFVLQDNFYTFLLFKSPASPPLSSSAAGDHLQVVNNIFTHFYHTHILCPTSYYYRRTNCSCFYAKPSLPHLDIRSYTLFPTQVSTILPFSPKSWFFSLYWSISINIQTCCDCSSSCYSSAPPLLHLLHHFSALLYSKIPWKNCQYSLCSHSLLNPLQSSIGPNHSTETAYFKVSNNLHLSISQLPIFNLLRLSAGFDTTDHRFLLFIWL